MKKNREDIVEYYQTAKAAKIALIFYLSEKRKIYSMLRLLFFLFSFIFLFTFPYGYNIVISVTSLMFFFVFARKDMGFKKTIYTNNKEKETIEKELRVISDNVFEFEDGSEFFNKDHNYTYDLDVFGKGSVYQYINRSITIFGSRTLCNWLESPTNDDEILFRQEAVKELSESPEYIISFISNITERKHDIDIEGTVEKIGETKFSQFKYIVTVILMSINLTFLMLFLFHFVSFLYLLLILCLNYFIIYCLLWNKHIKLNKQFEDCSQELNKYAHLFHIMGNTKFHSKKLIALQENISSSDKKTSITIGELAKLNKRFYYRLNLFFHLIVNTFIYFDIYQIKLIHSWVIKNKGNIQSWFKSLGEFEALICFANLLINNPEWSFPKIDTEAKDCIFENVGHPLISNTKRVVNNFHAKIGGEFSIITGSNMAGKSTFMRTIGINIILGLSGAPVCASKSKIPNVKVISQMKIQDSLAKNVSTFQAELDRIKKILQLSETHNDLFVIFDEPLKGTNSEDRFKGVKALINRLIKNEVSGLLATHDLKVTSISKQYSNMIFNYHFDISINDNNLEFDYKLREGVCNNFNASILLKKIGLDMTDDC